MPAWRESEVKRVNSHAVSSAMAKSRELRAEPWSVLAEVRPDVAAEDVPAGNDSGPGNPEPERRLSRRGDRLRSRVRLRDHSVVSPSDAESLQSLKQRIEELLSDDRLLALFGDVISQCFNQFGDVPEQCVSGGSVVSKPQPESKARYDRTDLEDAPNNFCPPFRNRVDGFYEFKTGRSASADDEWLIATALAQAQSDKTDLQNLNPMRRYVRRTAESQIFRWFIMAVIVFNSSLIGFQANWAITRVDESLPLWFRVFDIVATAIFTVEIALRIIGEGSNFFAFSNRDINWNIFDTAFVVEALVSEFVSYTFREGMDVTYMRVLRVFRLARFIRLVRFARNLFRDLRVMINGITRTLQSMLWAIGILVIFMYIVAVSLLQLAAIELPSLQDEASEASFLGFFPNLGSSIITLWQSVSGGTDWAGPFAALVAVSPSAAGVFLFYVVFTILCAMNVITGVFVESAVNATDQDEVAMLMSELGARQKHRKDLKKLFQTIDCHDTNRISYEELSKFLSCLGGQAQFVKLGLHSDMLDARSLFEFMDVNHNGKVSYEEFTEAMQQLSGGARVVDTVTIKQNVLFIRKELARFFSELHNDFHSACRPGLNRSQVAV